MIDNAWEQLLARAKELNVEIQLVEPQLLSANPELVFKGLLAGSPWMTPKIAEPLGIHMPARTIWINKTDEAKKVLFAIAGLHRYMLGEE